ncbi:MAG: hypothetical protein IPJ66_01305 [Bacteroidetes bacterium]|nr:hypothetical protein [Bacteroidota bacterium]MBL0064590.1 hypothetical protein [Bacteroidota bacterium]
MKKKDLYEIVDIRIFGKSVNVITDTDITNLQLSYKFETDFSIESKKRYVAIRHSIEIHKKSDDSVLALFDVGCAFKIGQGKITEPLEGIGSDLFIEINNSAISTIRGIIFVELSRTPLDKIILPLIPDEWFWDYYELKPNQFVKATSRSIVS